MKAKEEAAKIVREYLAKKKINPNAKVSVFFVSPEEIRKLNKKYRGVNNPTDVLSFPIWENKEDIPKTGKTALGDIFICLEQRGKHSVGFLIRHSLDHLLGKHHY